MTINEEALLAVYCSDSRKFCARVKEAEVQCTRNFSLQQNLNTDAVHVFLKNIFHLISE